MSGKLDQSLDEIMKDRKPAGGARRGKGRLPARAAAAKSKAATAAVVAPNSGVQKSARLNKTAKASAGAGGAPVARLTGDSKISVSNLPEDVTEHLIKDYFSKAIAPVKSAILNYTFNGRSRGSAVVTFSKPTAAAEAAKQLDGTRVDGKAMRIEVLVGAKLVPQPPPPKSLQDRIAKPKTAAQEKTKAKAGGKTGAANAKGARATKKQSGRVGRPKPKTAEELDAEMQDYFGGDANGVAAQPTAAVAATNGGDTGMVDEVM